MGVIDGRTGSYQLIWYFCEQNRNIRRVLGNVVQKSVFVGRKVMTSAFCLKMRSNSIRVHTLLNFRCGNGREWTSKTELCMLIAIKSFINPYRSKFLYIYGTYNRTFAWVGIPFSDAIRPFRVRQSSDTSKNDVGNMIIHNIHPRLHRLHIGYT